MEQTERDIRIARHIDRALKVSRAGAIPAQGRAGIQGEIMPDARAARDEFRGIAHRNRARSSTQCIHMLELNQSTIHHHAALEARIRATELEDAIARLRQRRRRAADQLAGAEQQLPVRPCINEIDRSIAREVDCFRRRNRIRARARVFESATIEDDAVCERRRCKRRLQRRARADCYIIRQRIGHAEPQCAARHRNRARHRIHPTQHQRPRAGLPKTKRPRDDCIDRVRIP